MLTMVVENPPHELLNRPYFAGESALHIVERRLWKDFFSDLLNETRLFWFTLCAREERVGGDMSQPDILLL